MKVLATALALLAFTASRAIIASAQEYAPLLQEDTVSVVKFNLERLDADALDREIDQFVAGVRACFDVKEPDARYSRIEVSATLKTILSYLQTLKERDVKRVYLVYNKRNDSPTNAFGCLAVPNSPVTAEDLDALNPEGSFFGFDHNGTLCVPLDSWGGSAREEEYLHERFFPSETPTSRPEIEAGMNAVESETASVVGVDLASSSGAWRKTVVSRRLKGLLDFLQVGSFDEYYEIEGKIDRFVADLSNRVSAATKLVRYSAWSVDVENRRASVLVQANSEEDAARLREIVESSVKGELSEFTSAILYVFSQQAGIREKAQVAATVVSGLLEMVKFDVKGATLSLTIDERAIASTLAEVEDKMKIDGGEGKGSGVSSLPPQASLNMLTLACHLYMNQNGGRSLPPAYGANGKTWREEGTLQPFVKNEAVLTGFAMLVDEDGIFVPTPGKTTSIQDVADGVDNTLAFVELADRRDERACVTLNEFYGQLRNCPKDRGGYYVAMASGRVEKLDRTTTLTRLKALTTKAGRDLYLSSAPTDARPRLDVLVRASARYVSAKPGRGYPPAYTEDGKTWLEAGTLAEFIGSASPVPGCAMLVDPDGIFEPTPGKSTRFEDAPARQAIMFVELADHEEIRACITADEFYEQLQNCPEDRKGYQVVMRGSYFTTVDKTISRDELQALVSKTVDPDKKKTP